MLSTEKLALINMRGLYRKQPPDNNWRTFHCKNWTFTPRMWNDNLLMVDTYFGNTYIEVDDDNFDEFEFVFDYDEVVRVPDSEVDEYDRNDLFCVATDSGGSNCGHLYWKKKSTEKSINRQIEKIRGDITFLESELAYKKRELSKLTK